MTEQKLQIFEDKDSFWILTDKAEIIDGAWFGDGYVDDKFAIVPKSIPDAKNRAQLIVDSVNNAQRYKEALQAIQSIKVHTEGMSTEDKINILTRAVHVLRNTAKNALKQ